MKKILSTLLFGIAICSFTACTNELDENTDRAELEVISNGQLLRFKDTNVYNETVQRISAMTDNDRKAFFDSLAFKPQMILIKEADEELRNICESTDVLAVAQKQYSEFKQKYGKVFMFNDSDVSDLSPYSKLVCPTNEFFANEKGQFMIGDSLVESVQFQYFKERKQQTQNVTTRDDVSTNNDINDAHSYKKDRKVGLRLYMEGQYIMANFTAQKKTWLGWVRYSTQYFANFTVYGAGFEFAQGDLLGKFPPYINIEGRPYHIATIEREGNYTTQFGRKATSGSCVGEMEIWSRGIIYSDRGLASIRL